MLTNMQILVLKLFTLSRQIIRIGQAIFSTREYIRQHITDICPGIVLLAIYMYIAH